MRHEDMNNFMMAIDILEAHEQKRGLEVASYPHLKREDQTKFINSINKRLQIEVKELDSHEIAKALGFI